MKAIHAFDRKLDLAILTVDNGTEPPPPPLEIAPAGDLSQGQRVFAMGNPQGYAFSIVEGIVCFVESGR